MAAVANSSISYPHYYSGSYPASTDTTERQSRPELRVDNNMSYPCYDQRTLQVPASAAAHQQPQKDYSKPLHVDCSVEYELPNTAKPPQGVRNEPLLMIHPCYFRKIESQRRSPFVNNLPVRSAVTRRRSPRGQQIMPQLPQLGAQYPAQFPTSWEQMPSLVPIASAAQYNKQLTAQIGSLCDSYTNTSACNNSDSLSNLWTPDRSPDRPDDKHILSGKYRQYLRAHRLHPYSSIPLASTFPQQVCYNV